MDFRDVLQNDRDRDAIHDGLWVPIESGLVGECVESAEGVACE
jgi:hypothetical protein